jgi:MFS family permease
MRRRVAAAARDTFRSLRTPNFRLFFVGQLVSQAGTWMETVALSWVVLRLTDSGVALGIVTAARYGPMLVLGPWGGVLSDRLDRHRLMLTTQIAFAAVAAALAVLMATDLLTVPLVYILSTAFGILMALDSPARRALVIELVEQDDVANAVGLNSAMMTGSRVVGPSLAGALIAGPGAAWCFALNAASYLMIIGSLLRMDRSTFRPAPRVPRAKGQLREGFRYVRRTPALLLPLVLAAVIGTFAFNYQVTLPLLAERSLGGDAATFTWLFAMTGLGSIAGALAIARRRTIGVRFLLAGGVAMVVATGLLAVAPTTPLALLAALPVGVTSTVMISGTNAVVQLEAAPAMRGRVLALVSMVFLGTAPIGGPILGWISEVLNPRAGLAVGGLATALAIVWTARQARRPDPGTGSGAGADGTDTGADGTGTGTEPGPAATPRPAHAPAAA